MENSPLSLCHNNPSHKPTELKAKSETKNMKTKLIICAVAALTVINGTQAQSRAGNAIPVTPDNFIRAETDHYFTPTVKNGGFGKFNHIRHPPPLNHQL